MSSPPISDEPVHGARYVAESPHRTGMTLIELLVVVAIIAVIAAVSIGALMVIPEHARVRGTEALVAKINTKLSQRLDQFNSRRDTVRTLGCDLTLANNEPTLGRLIAVARTMRQEFPEWFDVTLTSRISDSFDNDGDGLIDEPDEIIAGDWNPVDIGGTAAPEQLGSDLPPRATGHLAYIQRIFADNTLRSNGASFLNTHRAETARAECLFMLVTADGADTSEFAPNDIGDTDGDGIPEFVDKWGNPIQFFLWPSLYTSPRQKPGSETNPDDPNQLLTENLGPTSWWATNRGSFQNLFLWVSNAANTSPQAYRTYPLIISSGQDGGFGLVTASAGTDSVMGTLDDIATVDKRAIRISNAAQDGYGMDNDNIDNHGLRVR